MTNDKRTNRPGHHNEAATTFFTIATYYPVLNKSWVTIAETDTIEGPNRENLPAIQIESADGPVRLMPFEARALAKLLEQWSAFPEGVSLRRQIRAQRRWDAGEGSR